MNRLNNSDCLESQKLGRSVYQNVTVQPAKVYDREKGLYYGGMYDENYIGIENSWLVRDWGIIVRTKSEPLLDDFEEIEVKSGVWVFGGYLLGPYGHFLLESLSRTWALSEFRYDGIIWIPLHPTSEVRSFSVWQSELFGLLDLSDRKYLICNEQVRFEKVIVPDPGYIIRTFASVQYLNSLKLKLPFDSFVHQYDKVWVSRSLLKSNRGWSNENEIENLLSNLGWHIYHPESDRVVDQVCTFANCRRLAGSEGSALHTLVLCNSLPDRVDIFPRAKVINENFRTIANALGMKQVDHELEVQKDATHRHSGTVTNIYAVPVLLSLPTWLFSRSYFRSLLRLFLRARLSLFIYRYILCRKLR